MSEGTNEGAFVTDLLYENKEIYTHYNKIDILIENLDEKIDNILNSHEMEFLLAYRNHITKLNNEN